MSPKKNTAGEPKHAQFRPEKLRAPAKGESHLEYRAYCASYSFYLEYLEALRRDFWEGVEKPKSKYNVSVVPRGVKENPHADNEKVLEKEVLTIKKGETLKKEEKVTQPTPPTKLSEAERKARKTAKAKRRKLRKKESSRKAQVEVLKSKTKLAEAKVNYAAALKKDRVEPVRKETKKKDASSSGTKPAKAQKKKKKKPRPRSRKAKDEGGGGGPSDGPPKPPGPSDKKGKGKGPPERDQDQPPKGGPSSGPNRKARRFAVFGAPTGVPAREVVGDEELRKLKAQMSAAKIRHGPGKKFEPILSPSGSVYRAGLIGPSGKRITSSVEGDVDIVSPASGGPPIVLAEPELARVLGAPVGAAVVPQPRRLEMATREDRVMGASTAQYQTHVAGEQTRKSDNRRGRGNTYTSTGIRLVD